jgi:hypothetical protein
MSQTAGASQSMFRRGGPRRPHRRAHLRPSASGAAAGPRTADDANRCLHVSDQRWRICDAPRAKQQSQRPPPWRLLLVLCGRLRRRPPSGGWRSFALAEQAPEEAGPARSVLVPCASDLERRPRLPQSRHVRMRRNRQLVSLRFVPAGCSSISPRITALTRSLALARSAAPGRRAPRASREATSRSTGTEGPAWNG